MLGLPPKMKILPILAKKIQKWKLNFPRHALFHMKIRVCLKSFADDSIWKQLFVPNLPQNPLNFIPSTVLGTLRLLTKFKAKIRAINLQKCTKTCLA